MLRPPTDAEYVALGKNADGVSFPIAYGKTQKEARENGNSAQDIIRMAGGDLQHIQVMGLDIWLGASESEHMHYQKIKAIVSDWLSKRKHDRCWYYPELLEMIAEHLGLYCPTPDQVSRDEFELGCEHFTDEEYGPSDPDTIRLKVTVGFSRRREINDPHFEQKWVNVLKHLLMYNIGAALSAEGLAHDVMPDYKKTKVSLYGKRHPLPTVPHVEKNGERRDDPDKLDTGGIRQDEQDTQAEGRRRVLDQWLDRKAGE